MTVLCVDDNKYALSALSEAIKAERPDAEIYSFTGAIEACDFVKKSCEKLDAAFLDVEMPGMSGLELAVEVKKTFPRASVIFVTAYSMYMRDAFKIHAGGYVLKPVTQEAIKPELDELDLPFRRQATKRIVAHTFGNFELYGDGRTVKFGRSKSKELFAYLVDRRGCFCTMDELAAVLFDGAGDVKADKHYVRNIISDLKSSLRAVNAESVIIKMRNAIAVNVNAIDCDYYRLLAGEPSAVNEFTGEYMTNYSWAEFTLAALSVNTERYKIKQI